MKLGPDGLEIIEIDRSRDRYFITEGDDVERETDGAGFISLERSCGFRPKPGCGPFATGGFSSGNRSGRIETWFEGRARITDGSTGETSSHDTCTEAYDRAREMNAREGRRRYYVGPDLTA